MLAEVDEAWNFLDGKMTSQYVTTVDVKVLVKQKKSTALRDSKWKSSCSRSSWIKGGKGGGKGGGGGGGSRLYSVIQFVKSC